MTGAIIGGVLGFVYVMANASTLPNAPAQVLRTIAVVAFVGLLVAMRRARRLDGAPSRARFGRAYWCTVAGEVIAIVAGAVVLTGPLHAGDAVIAWISLVVGAHFFVLAAVWHQPFHDALGAAITTCGAAGLAAAVAGASAAVIATVAGLAPGFVLLGVSYRPIVRATQRG